MKISVSSSAPLEFATPCLLVPLWSEAPLQGVAAQLDAQLGGLIADIVASDNYKAKPGETRTLYTPGQSAPRVLLFGLGKQAPFSASVLRKAVAKAARVARGLKKSECALVLPTPANMDAQAVAQAATEGLILGLARFSDFKSDPEEKRELEGVTLLVGDETAARQGSARAQVLAAANLKCRALVNAPSNFKSPEFLAQTAREIGAAQGLKVTVWDEQKIQDEKMGALWAVGMGSDNPPRFIVLEYAPAGTQTQAPIVLVGKGITFDTGGYSIKPAASMEDMKDDMAGAAIVLGALSALAGFGGPKTRSGRHRVGGKHDRGQRATARRHRDRARRHHHRSPQHRRRRPPGFGRCAGVGQRAEARRHRGFRHADRRHRHRAGARGRRIVL